MARTTTARPGTPTLFDDLQPAAMLVVEAHVALEELRHLLLTADGPCDPAGLAVLLEGPRTCVENARDEIEALMLRPDLGVAGEAA